MVILQAFCKLVGIETLPVQDITPDQLAAAPFPQYTPLFSSIEVSFLPANSDNVTLLLGLALPSISVVCRVPVLENR